MTTCPRCKKTLPASVRFCGYCRKRQPEAPDRVPPIGDASATLRCGRCGFLNPAGFRCCAQCGDWLDATGEDRPARPHRAGRAGGAGTLPWASSAKGSDARVVHIRPDGAEAEHRITGDRLVIARESREDGAGIAIPEDGFLSSRHAEVVRRAGRFWLRDLGSTNGTFVRIRGECELRPGDQILIGGSIFKYVP